MVKRSERNEIALWVFQSEDMAEVQANKKTVAGELGGVVGYVVLVFPTVVLVHGFHWRWVLEKTGNRLGTSDQSIERLKRISRF